MYRNVVRLAIFVDVMVGAAGVTLAAMTGRPAGIWTMLLALVALFIGLLTLKTMGRGRR